MITVINRYAFGGGNESTLARKLLIKSSVSLACAKKSMNSGFDMDLAAAMDMHECFFARCFSTEDQKEGMQAFSERRKPQFKNR